MRVNFAVTSEGKFFLLEENSYKLVDDWHDATGFAGLGAVHRITKFLMNLNMRPMRDYKLTTREVPDDYFDRRENNG